MIGDYPMWKRLLESSVGKFAEENCLPCVLDWDFTTGGKSAMKDGGD
jgi:hypothetical protein